MKIFLKRAALVFSLWALVSVFALNNFGEAKANITWTTTAVKLESGKCTLKGYFSNSGDTSGTVTNIRFIVDVMTKDKKKNIYSNIWTYEPKNLVVPAGGKKSWNCWLNDKNCPRYTGALNWNVKWENLRWK